MQFNEDMHLITSWSDRRLAFAPIDNLKIYSGIRERKREAETATDEAISRHRGLVSHRRLLGAIETSYTGVALFANPPALQA